MREDRFLTFHMCILHLYSYISGVFNRWGLTKTWKESKQWQEVLRRTQAEICSEETAVRTERKNQVCLSARSFLGWHLVTSHPVFASFLTCLVCVAFTFQSACLLCTDLPKFTVKHMYWTRLLFYIKYMFYKIIWPLKLLWIKAICLIKMCSNANKI